jgi:hypothetical protein
MDGQRRTFGSSLSQERVKRITMQVHSGASLNGSDEGSDISSTFQAFPCSNYGNIKIEITENRPKRLFEQRHRSLCSTEVVGDIKRFTFCGEPQVLESLAAEKAFEESIKDNRSDYYEQGDQRVQSAHVKQDEDNLKAKMIISTAQESGQNALTNHRTESTNKIEDGCYSDSGRIRLKKQRKTPLPEIQIFNVEEKDLQNMPTVTPSFHALVSSRQTSAKKEQQAQKIVKTETSVSKEKFVRVKESINSAFLRKKFLPTVLMSQANSPRTIQQATKLASDKYIISHCSFGEEENNQVNSMVRSPSQLLAKFCSKIEIERSPPKVSSAEQTMPRESLEAGKKSTSRMALSKICTNKYGQSVAGGEIERSLKSKLSSQTLEKLTDLDQACKLQEEGKLIPKSQARLSLPILETSTNIDEIEDLDTLRNIIRALEISKRSKETDLLSLGLHVQEISRTFFRVGKEITNFR